MKLVSRPAEGNAGAAAAAAAVASADDGLDRLPDDVLVRVLDIVSDVRTLARCRCLNRRFASLVPQAEHLHVGVDAVVSPSSSAPFFFSSSHTGSGLLFLIVPLLHRVLFSLLNSISALLYDPDDKPPRATARVLCGAAPRGEDAGHNHQQGSEEPSKSSPCAPSLLLGFHRVRTLRIELPAGERPRISTKGADAAVLRWRAVFRKRLRTCVVLAARYYGPMAMDDAAPAPSAAARGGHEEEGEHESATGLKERVVWTIGALIAASARHHMAKEVAMGEKGGDMESLVVADQDGEGVVQVRAEGLREWREEDEETRKRRNRDEFLSLEIDGDDDPATAERKGRTTVPAVKMTMRHAGKLDLGGGVGMRGAALVIVRAVEGPAAAAGDHQSSAAELEDEGALVESAFQQPGDEVFMTAARRILKRPSYLLEMNSF